MANFTISAADIKDCMQTFIESYTICVPLFYEGEQLPLGYFASPDPYAISQSPEVDLGKLADYMRSNKKTLRTLTKEELKMFKSNKK